MPSAATLTNLYDAFGREIDGVRHDFGFSTMVEYNGKTILVDAGTNAEIFENNLRSLNVDLRKVDIAIISHGHYDHMGGLHYLFSVNPNVKLYLPSDFFSVGAPSGFPFKEPEPLPETLSEDEQYFRGAASTDAMVSDPTGTFWGRNIEYVTEAKEVLPGVTLIPTTATLMGTFIKYPPFEQNPQHIGMPELSVSFATERGQIIISGCSHTGIEEIIKATRKIRKEKILLVTGGFHLIPYPREYIEGIAKRMKDVHGVEFVAPAHCTGHTGFAVFREVFGDRYRFFGLGEKITPE
jgi:7,8-dihydropterin-6-yl-methyl-4-(beta-D-ribofuranosyl)aminobenzene 5'-phosphate synthase